MKKMYVRNEIWKLLEDEMQIGYFKNVSDTLNYMFNELKNNEIELLKLEKEVRYGKERIRL